MTSLKLIPKPFEVMHISFEIIQSISIQFETVRNRQKPSGIVLCAKMRGAQRAGGGKPSGDGRRDAQAGQQGIAEASFCQLLHVFCLVHILYIVKWKSRCCFRWGKGRPTLHHAEKILLPFTLLGGIPSAVLSAGAAPPEGNLCNLHSNLILNSGGALAPPLPLRICFLSVLPGT